MAVYLGDASPTFAVGDSPVSRLYQGDTLVWAALLDFSDDFNQANGPLDVDTKYEYITTSPYKNLPPTVVSNHLEAQDPGTTNGDTIFGLTLPRKQLNYTNRRCEFDLIGPINSTAQAGLVARATDDGLKSFQFNIVAASHGGLRNADNFVATNRTSYDQTQLAVGDVCGVEVYGDQYVAYRRRSGVRLNLTAYQDSGGTLVPLTATRYGFYIIATRASGVNQKGAPFDNFHAWDLPDRVAGDFIESGMVKNGSTFNFNTNNAWSLVTGWADNPNYPGGTGRSSDRLLMPPGKPTVDITASLPYSGAALYRQHTMRIVDQSGNQLAISSTNTATAATLTASVTGQSTSGITSIGIEVRSNNTNSGTVSASTPWLAIT